MKLGIQRFPHSMGTANQITPNTTGEPRNDVAGANAPKRRAENAKHTDRTKNHRQTHWKIDPGNLKWEKET